MKVITRLTALSLAWVVGVSYATAGTYEAVSSNAKITLVGTPTAPKVDGIAFTNWATQPYYSYGSAHTVDFTMSDTWRTGSTGNRTMTWDTRYQFKVKFVPAPGTSETPTGLESITCRRKIITTASGSALYFGDEPEPIQSTAYATSEGGPITSGIAWPASSYDTDTYLADNTQLEAYLVNWSNATGEWIGTVDYANAYLLGLDMWFAATKHASEWNLNWLQMGGSIRQILRAEKCGGQWIAPQLT